MRVVGVKQKVPFYTLDVIISVGYRVKSKRGVEFRRWANSVLKQYILQGYAVNDNRIAQLGEVIRIMKRTQNALDSQQVLNVIQKYSNALELLDSYDHQNMERPKGSVATYELTYEECKDVISQMRFGAESDLFGKEFNGYFCTSMIPLAVKINFLSALSIIKIFKAAIFCRHSNDLIHIVFCHYFRNEPSECF